MELYLYSPNTPSWHGAYLTFTRGWNFTYHNDLEFTLQTLADEKQITDIDLAALVSVGLVSKRAKVKILANGAVTTALTVKAHAFSQAARTAIEAAGGKTELIQSKNAQSTIDA